MTTLYCPSSPKPVCYDKSKNMCVAGPNDHFKDSGKPNNSKTDFLLSGMNPCMLSDFGYGKELTYCPAGSTKFNGTNCLDKDGKDLGKPSTDIPIDGGSFAANARLIAKFMPGAEDNDGKKKPIYKEIWFWLIIVLVIMLMVLAFMPFMKGLGSKKKSGVVVTSPIASFRFR